MSVRVMSWVFEHSPVQHRGDLLALLVLADHAHDDGTNAYPGVDTIASRARLSRRGVFDALARLKAAGAIVADGRGPRGTIAYRVVMEGVQSLHRAATAPVQSPAQGGAVTSTLGVQCPAPEPSFNRQEPSIPPNPPQAGGDPLPPLTKGKRERDIAQSNTERLAWAERRGVTAHDWRGRQAILRLLRQQVNGDETAEQLQALALSPTWADSPIVVTDRQHRSEAA